MAPSAPVDPRTGLEAARRGVYIHFPYCLSKCPYCDFASVATKQIPQERYTRAILRELEHRVRAHRLERKEVDSIFIGGGTPSLWAPEWVASVLEALARTCSLSSACEVTLEANPGASDAERFAAYRKAGINRLSMGVQSFNASTLAALGRSHDGPAALRAYAAARRAGFENVSMDFIYGVFEQTLAQVEADARQAVLLGPEHLSAYQLTLDKASLAEEVPLARQLARGEVQLPPDETVVHMQRSIRDIFRGGGLWRYEISNYAKPGYHSRHNALYWTGGEYLALGAGATGFLRGSPPVRYSNHRSAERYLTQVEACQLPEASREELLPGELFGERVAMGLRLVNGVDLEGICQDFGQNCRRLDGPVEQLIRSGLAERRSGRLALTDVGFDLHSAVSVTLM